MANRLKEEIKQTKPFSGLEHEAVLNIRRSASYLEHLTQQVVKSRGLTEAQYNVLRILRGAEPDGLRCSEIGERMITRDPDVTRLIRRLQGSGLVGRRRDRSDRRVVHIRIREKGRQLLKELDPLIESSGRSLLGHMSSEHLSLLIDLLEEVRQPECEATPAARTTADGQPE